jgi:hypothetical protein
MPYAVKIYSKTQSEIEKFLNTFFESNFNLGDKIIWEKEFEDPTQIIDIATAFIDNKEKFKVNMLISLDKDIYIFISENNINKIVKYIYERFPY